MTIIVTWILFLSEPSRTDAAVIVNTSAVEERRKFPIVKTNKQPSNMQQIAKYIFDFVSLFYIFAIVVGMCSASCTRWHCTGLFLVKCPVQMGRLAFREERNSIFVLYLDDKISHASHRAFELTDRGFLSMFVFDIFTSSMQPSTVNVLGGRRRGVAALLGEHTWTFRTITKRGNQTSSCAPVMYQHTFLIYY